MKIFIGLFLTVCTIIFGILFATPSTNGQKEQTDEATIVHKGQTTEKEREYSKEYRKLNPFKNGRKFTEMIELSNRLGKTTEELGGIIGEDDVAQSRTPHTITSAEFLKNLSCKSDAIVLGSVKSKSSHMTDDETFIYTEYDFSVRDILKNNSVSPIEVNNSIEITRPGGLIKIDNRRIRIEDRTYEPFQKNMEYLLFLRFVPSTNGYMAASYEGDFVLENNTFNKLARNRPLPKELEKNSNPQELLDKVRNSVLSNCNQKTAGENQ